MRKLLFVFGFLMISASTVFAQKYITRTGKLTFNATAPSSPEKIEAVNNEVANILDAKTGDLVFQVLVKSFKFERELMQEHFNENYMESDKYPKAEFKGSVTDIGNVNFSKDGNYNIKVTGTVTMHGVSNPITVPGTITVKGNTATLKGQFKLNLKSYKIDIPSLVSDKVAKDVTVTLESTLTQK